MFSTGFSMDAAALAEDMDGPTIGWMREEAAAMGCVLAGSLIVREGGRHFNRLVWARPDGTLAHYDKRHLFRMAGEQQHYAAGDRRLVVEIKGWRVCPMVCYDLRFPVWSRNRGDYDLLLYVANWPARRAHAWSALLRARAIENLSYVVGVNRIGRDGNGTSYAGDSVALDFLGQPLSSEGGGDRVGDRGSRHGVAQVLPRELPGAPRRRRVRAAMRKRTRVTHLPDVKVAPDNRPLVAPIYQSVKFSFDDVGETQKYWTGQRDGFYYSRVSNPTLRQLELVLARTAGPRGRPAHRLGRRRNLDDAARAAAGRGPRRVLRRDVPADACAVATAAGSLRRDEHDAVGHRPRVHRADARRRPRRSSSCSSRRRTRS